MPAHRASLPIDAHLPQIVGHMRTANRLILQAPPGAGKTTRVPPALLDAGLASSGQIILLEPRRLAARAAASRIAQERGQELGQDVGYQVRFERRAGRNTRIIAVTPGILLRWLQDDAVLSRAGIVIFDEFHERGVDADLALGMLKLVQESLRPELKLVVMSATLASEELLPYLEDCPIVRSEGRLFPVRVEHQPRPVSESLAQSVRTVLPAVLERTSGDVLVFLPGMGEIRQAERLFQQDLEGDAFVILPLHGDLPLEEQAAALAPAPRPKVVLATNVAESSITVEGITAVIDTGQARLLEIDAGLGIDRLELKPISRASAEQRAGRAGRTAPGLCVRLWSEAWQRSLPEQTPPEIRRVDLAGPLLHLQALGEGDWQAFPWLSPPPADNVAAALSLLERLGAVAGKTITPLGRLLARLPVHPRLGRLLVEGWRLGDAPRAALAAALLGERDVFARAGPRDGARRGKTRSDVLDRVEVLNSWSARRGADSGLDVDRVQFILHLQRQLIRVLEQEGQDPTSRAVDAAALSPASGERGRGEGAQHRLAVTASPADPDEPLLRALLAAYPDRIARRRQPGDRRALMLGGTGVVLSPASGVLEGELFLAIDLDTRPAEAVVRLASSIQRDWLSPERLRSSIEVFFDEAAEKVTARKQLLLDDLVLQDSPATVPNDDQVRDLLIAAASANLSRVLPEKDSAAAAYVTRVRCLASWLRDLSLPSFSEADMAEMLPYVAAGVSSFAQMRRGPWLDLCRGKLTPAQLRAVEREAPQAITVPSGRAVALVYEEGRPPVLAARIQELFGLSDTPRIAGGRVKVLLHLLAPNYRPQQITDDLASFWKNTYAQVRKDLRARYPKHAWPEDPSVAVAVRK